MVLLQSTIAISLAMRLFAAQRDWAFHLPPFLFGESNCSRQQCPPSEISVRYSQSGPGLLHRLLSCYEAESAELTGGWRGWVANPIGVLVPSKRREICCHPSSAWACCSARMTARPVVGGLSG
ncbi:hypothetical protein F4802DRAFT_430566 [Xylaria palmicola]|nr:hypothetical protein F4802DRAFT_430566 [Xylaria palmicola]